MKNTSDVMIAILMGLIAMCVVYIWFSRYIVS